MNPLLVKHPLRTRMRRRAIALCLVVASVAAAALATGAQAAPRPPKPPPSNPAKVMTRNIYLGADLTRSIQATTIPDLLAANAQIFANVQQTNFPERAKALAREIKDADPVLIGVQEAATWSSGPFNNPAPATTVEYDFLASLQSELAAVGQPYNVARFQQEADLESPAGSPYFKDFRLQMRDVILVKAGVAVSLSNAQSANFVNNLTLTTGTGQSITVKRGWASVDAVVNNRSFRFVDTHLEAFHPGVRAQQAQELVAASGPVGSAPGKVVLVGDINSDPNQSSPNNLAYNVLVGSGMSDTWLTANPGDPGLTSGFSELLDDPSAASVFDSRIDHILTKGPVGVSKSKIYGTDPDNRTAGGLWPSDHAGVAATLTP
jgi:endonuclease/exonuclease/phosphatase family metal-dependent hydrolase